MMKKYEQMVWAATYGATYAHWYPSEEAAERAQSAADAAVKSLRASRTKYPDAGEFVEP